MRTALRSVAPPRVRTPELVHPESCPRYAERKAAAEKQESAFPPKVRAEAQARSLSKRCSNPSVTNCRISRPRPAPNANRTAISLRLESARDSNRFETLLQEISSRRLTEPISSPKISPVRRGHPDPCQNWESHPHCDARSNSGMPPQAAPL